jgi:uncharacterized membrane protein
MYHTGQTLKKFLGIPLVMLLTAIVLSLALYALDHDTPGWLRPTRQYLSRHLFPSSDTTGAFLGGVAGGMFTKTSIVVSMLLLVLQQTASVMGNFIYDQFLRRHRNQLFSGYVVGTLLVALILRTTVGDDFNPVLGAMGVLILIIISMGLLIWFLHSTIQQMRPEVIVETVHDQTDQARERELEFLRHFRSEAQVSRPPEAILYAETHGFLAHIDPETIADCFQAPHPPHTEVNLQVQLGSYVAYHQPLAHINAETTQEAERLARCVGSALRFAKERNMEQDPAYGIKQLEAIGWTEMSTAQDNPETGLIVLYALRNLMSRWTDETATDAPDADPLPIVYAKDTRRDLLDAWESLVIAASESMQHQAFAEVLDSLAHVYPRLPSRLKDRADMLIRRAISSMGEHVLTQDVDSAIQELIRVLNVSTRYKIAITLKTARDKLAASVGKLANRSTRSQQTTQQSDT